MARDPIGPARGGGVSLLLPRDVRATITSVARGLLQLYESESAADDPAVARLSPTAYPDDPLANIRFDGSVGDELRRGRLDAIAVVERTSDATRLTADEAQAWLRTLNDARLVLGTRLNVTEETGEGDFAADPAAADSYETYVVLSVVVEMFVRALEPTG
ncbi:MAG TPA: DUF2017 family protein [Actinomycetota bacterium]